MVKHAPHTQAQRPPTTQSKAGVPDPALAAVVKYLARWAAERDYEEHLKNTSESARAAAAPQEPDS